MDANPRDDKQPPGTLEQGVTYVRRASSNTAFTYLVRTPDIDALDADTANSAAVGALVLVRGLATEARAMLALLTPYADQHGYTLIAPVFPSDLYPNYHLFNAGEQEVTPDLALTEILNDAGAQTPIPDQIQLCGYGEGAQFVLRFVSTHPERVDRYAMISAPAYSASTVGQRKPQGTKLVAQIPSCTMIGEWDVQHDTVGRAAAKPDNETHRLERASAWVDHIRQLTPTNDGHVRHELRVLRNTGRSLEEAMRKGHLGEFLFQFLTADDLD